MGGGRRGVRERADMVEHWSFCCESLARRAQADGSAGYRDGCEPQGAHVGGPRWQVHQRVCCRGSISFSRSCGGWTFVWRFLSCRWYIRWLEYRPYCAGYAAINRPESIGTESSRAAPKRPIESNRTQPKSKRARQGQTLDCEGIDCRAKLNRHLLQSGFDGRTKTKQTESNRGDPSCIAERLCRRESKMKGRLATCAASDDCRPTITRGQTGGPSCTSQGIAERITNSHPNRTPEVGIVTDCIHPTASGNRHFRFRDAVDICGLLGFDCFPLVVIPG